MRTYKVDTSLTRKKNFTFKRPMKSVIKTIQKKTVVKPTETKPYTLSSAEVDMYRIVASKKHRYAQVYIRAETILAFVEKIRRLEERLKQRATNDAELQMLVSKLSTITSQREME